MDIDVRKMNADDIEGVARVHALAFLRQNESCAWIECNFRAYPRMQHFVAEAAGRIVGYIHWTQKSGFRSEVVLELEQLAVDPICQGQGIGRQLIVRSLPQVRAQLRERGARLKHVMVTTRTDNHAQELYRRTLGAEVETILRDLYSGDEVLMIARNLPDDV
jgi:ribosomal protein S18 acetylase RimI-like enzyme